MKSWWIIGVLLLLGSYCVAQEGTNFEDLSFKEALKKAGEADKPLFIDCYTKTCVPCKYMVKYIFPLKECGDYFNSRYICIMKDMEEGDGLEIAKQYQVMVYPTYLILNSDGTEICRICGGVSSPEQDFVKKVKEAMDRVEMNKKYQAGERGEAFLQEYIQLLLQSDQSQLQKVMGEVFLGMGVDKLCEKQNWELIQSQLDQIDNPLFRYLLKERKAFARRLGKQVVTNKLLNTYAEEFRVYKLMGLDYPARMADLKLLEKEGCIQASALRYAMLCRDVIDGEKKEQVGEIIKMLKKDLPALSVPGAQMQIIRELGQIDRIATPEQLRQICEALIAFSKQSDGTDAGYVRYLIERFSKNKE